MTSRNFVRGITHPMMVKIANELGLFPLTAACEPEPKLKTFDHFAEGELPGTLELSIGRQGIV